MTAATCNIHALSDQRLRESLDDAEVLLQHAAKTGKQLAPTIANAVLSTREALKSSNLALPIEEAFWVQFAELSRIMQPATIEGIRETRPDNSSWIAFLFRRLRWRSTQQDAASAIPAAYRSVAWYTSIVTLLLACVIGFQIQTSYGALILDNITKLEAQKRQLSSDSSLAAAARESRTSDIDSSESANIDLLGTFNDLTNPWFNRGEHEDPIRAIERAQLALVWLNGFILPLFVGGLGAAAQILRSLAQQIKDDSYSSEERLHFRVRLALGVLAGAAVGLLFVANAPAAEATANSKFGVAIGPLAFPFLAGYSIEFFFSVLDKIIGAFKLQ